MPRPVAKCGTPSGYNRHRSRDEKACPECLSANSAATNRRQKRNRPRAKAGTPYKSRTLERMDADFERLRGSDKRCAGCHQDVARDGYARDRNSPDGRQKRCSANRCAYLSRRTNATAPAVTYWVSVGINADTCFYCQTSPFEEIDHVLPKCRGGSDSPENLAPSCSSCNRGPGGKLDLPVLGWLTLRFPDRVPEVVQRFPLAAADRL
jgi:hypothetical protein